MNERSTIWMAVVNVFAASKKAGALWNTVEKELQAHGVEYHSRMTGRSGCASDIAFDACVVGYRRFLSVGGDGTVHDVLNGIASFVEWKAQSGESLSMADFTIGVIPVGSGNDWIKSAKVPKDIKKVAALIASGKTARQDVVKVSVLGPDGRSVDAPIAVSYMINVGGIGLDARVCTRVNMKKKHGHRGKILYVTSLIHAIYHRVPAFAKVYCDGEKVFEGPYFSIAFGIGMYSGGGMRQTPAAVMDDGMLDMTLIPELPLGKIAREAPRLFTGTFLEVPELISKRGRSIEVLPYGEGGHEPVEVDGEVIGKAPVRFDVLETQIHVVSDR